MRLRDVRPAAAGRGGPAIPGRRGWRHEPRRAAAIDREARNTRSRACTMLAGMRSILVTIMLACASCAGPGDVETEPGATAGDTAAEAATAAAEVAAVLDDFHAAASAADEARYLGHMAPDGVFLGTDASERWDRDGFRAFVHPHFSRGRGWTYAPRDRHVALAAGGEVAWFDEALDHARYGELRGTGVLRKIQGTWKIAQYNLTFTIPNQASADVVARVRASQGAAQDAGAAGDAGAARDPGAGQAPGAAE